MMTTAATRIFPKAIEAPEPVRFAMLKDVAACLVGGDLLFREGLKRLFHDTPIKVVGEAAGFTEALAAEHGRVDVVILLETAGETGPAMAHLPTLRSEWPGVRTVVLATRADPNALAVAVRAGVE